jgi:hypothetical protein
LKGNKMAQTTYEEYLANLRGPLTNMMAPQAQPQPQMSIFVNSEGNAPGASPGEVGNASFSGEVGYDQ